MEGGSAEREGSSFGPVWKGSVMEDKSPDKCILFPKYLGQHWPPSVPVQHNLGALHSHPRATTGGRTVDSFAFTSWKWTSTHAGFNSRVWSYPGDCFTKIVCSIWSPKGGVNVSMIKPDAILRILEIVINSSPRFTNDHINGVKIKESDK